MKSAICLIALFITTTVASPNFWTYLLHGADNLVNNAGNDINLATHAGVEGLGKLSQYGCNLLEQGVTGISNDAARLIPGLATVSKAVDNIANRVDYLANDGLEDVGSATQKFAQTLTGLAKSATNTVVNALAPTAVKGAPVKPKVITVPKPAPRPVPKPAPKPAPIIEPKPAPKPAPVSSPSSSSSK